jgi:hypothetical protein
MPREYLIHATLPCRVASPSEPGTSSANCIDVAWQILRRISAQTSIDV